MLIGYECFFLIVLVFGEECGKRFRIKVSAHVDIVNFVRNSEKKKKVKSSSALRNLVGFVWIILFYISMRRKFLDCCREFFSYKTTDLSSIFLKHSNYFLNSYDVFEKDSNLATL